MRLTAIILLSACITASAKTGAQGITLSVKNASLEKVFEEIKKQTGYSFVYNNSLVANTRKISITVSRATVDEVLQQALKDQPLSYEIVNRTIIIKPKPPGHSGLDPKSFSQLPPPIDVKGRITNEEGQPVAGASVKIKGTDIGTSTNDNGEFVLNVLAPDMVLVISGVNIETIEVPIAARTNIVINVKNKVSPLDEMQVIAYGTKSKRLQTGNVATVKAEDIEKQPVSNPLLALQGRVPGLFITQNTGLPGGGVSVQIQGQNSLQRGNDPLYIVDGVPYISQLLPSINAAGILGSSGKTFGSQQGNPLNYLNPADIESIEILKDAGSTAIYGSRGANGVILITTKKGKAGEIKVDADLKLGWGKVAERLDLLNTGQYLEMRREAKKNDNAAITASDYDLNGTWDTTRNTDWQKEFIGGTANFKTVQLNISGGNTNTQYLVGGGYHKETTVFPGDFNDQNASMHFNIKSASTNKKFNFLFTGNFLTDNNKLIQQDLTSKAISLTPVAPPIYNADGSLNWAHNSSGSTTWSGPVGGNPLSLLELKYNNRTNNLIGSSLVSYEVVKGLEIKTSLGYTSTQTTELTANPNSFSDPAFWPIIGNNLRTAKYGNGNATSWIIEPHLIYRALIGRSKLETLLGSTFQQNTTNLQQYIGKGYNNDLVLGDPNAASQITTGTTVASKYKYNALFGRLSYNFSEKYIADFTIRRDGSSRFGSENQYHNFGSIAAGWVFSQERLFQKRLPIISFGKLRASFGTTGNDLIGDYGYLSLYSVTSGVDIPYQGSTGLEPNSLKNPYLQWEETKKLQAGLDLGFVKDRFLFSINYFNNRSSNQLLLYPLPTVTGFESITKNFEATVQNSGLEFSLNTGILKNKNVSWTSNINLSIPKNKLISFPNLSSSPYSTIYIIGEPINLVHAFHLIGADKSTGQYQFANSQGSPTTSPNSSTDRTVLINDKFPKYYGGFQNTFQFRRFELDILFQFVKQIGLSYLFGSNPGTIRNNQPISVLSRWQKPGDNSIIQRYNSNFSLLNSNSLANRSDAAYSDASYIRLKNASISWQVSDRWLKRAHLRNFKVFLQGQNLATITNYIGLDPETKSSTTLPPLRMVAFGFQLGL